MRRRFWERVLRAVDKTGTGAQLRTQLWIVYDAVGKIADLPLGHVFDAAFIFDQIQSRVLQSGVLLQKISEKIAKQVHEEHGGLRFRLCARIFLIGQLPHQGPDDAAIRATPEALADLLVTDLTRSSAELRKTIGGLLERLAREITNWENNRDLIGQRLPRWHQLVEFLKFAADLPVAAEVQPEVKAIKHHRKLLANPDPVPGLVGKLAGALRTALNEAHGGCSADYEARITALEVMPTWKQLKPEERYGILSKNDIRVLPSIAVGTPEDVIDTLRHTKLSELRAISHALPTRFGNAPAAAARLLEPMARSVDLPKGTIKNEDDLQTWLSQTGELIRQKLKDGPVIVS